MAASSRASVAIVDHRSPCQPGHGAIAAVDVSAEEPESRESGNIVIEHPLAFGKRRHGAAAPLICRRQEHPLEYVVPVSQFPERGGREAVSAGDTAGSEWRGDAAVIRHGAANGRG
jgi:hypothetical protein